MILVLPAVAMHRSGRALPARATFPRAYSLLVAPHCLGQPASAPHIVATPKEHWSSDPVSLLWPPALSLQGTGLQWEGHCMDCAL